MNNKRKIFTYFSPQTSLAFSFMGIILVGALVLCLPVCAAGERASFIDALFTATSATCVTGLTVVDTSSYWTTTGQVVILVLIQIGGLGIITFSSFFILLIARRLRLADHELIEQSFVAGKSSLKQVLWAVILSTFAVEGIGAVLLSARFAQDYPTGEAIYSGVFHAVSAFCNAGFSLYSSNLVAYRGDALVNITVMMLIFLGGIGFWVMFDLLRTYKQRKTRRPTSLHTRVVLNTSLWLILAGFVVLLIIEWNLAFAGMPISEKILAALFQSVTPRTAGFNTVDIAALTNSSIFFIVLLMFIGASPGSCGGGIKTSTFAILLAMVFARMTNQKQVRIYHRGIPDITVAKAIGVTSAAVGFVGLICFFLLISETTVHIGISERTLFIELIFEAVSALGTVGLSMGITPFLTSSGKFLIVLLMYVGRLGPITLTLALAGLHARQIRYAEDNVWIG